jgi:hypothetical protein
MVLDFAANHEGMRVHIAHPGMVTSSTTFWRTAQAGLFGFTNLMTRAIPNVSQEQVSAAIMDQLFHGFEKETLSNVWSD